MINSKFIIRFDDITPNMAWSKFKLIEHFLLEKNIKPIIGVVPDCKDSSLHIEEINIDFWEKIRFWRDQGWTIAQHGYQHLYVTNDAGILGINKKSEFSGLPFNEQLEKILAGKAILESNEVWQPVFMAPSHSFDKNTLCALEQANFLYVTDGYGLYPYDIGQLTFVPQLFSSPLHFGTGIYTLCLHINTMSEYQIKEIIGKIENLNVISFYDAICVVSNCNIFNNSSRLVLKAAIKSAKTLRRIVK